MNETTYTGGRTDLKRLTSAIDSPGGSQPIHKQQPRSVFERSRFSSERFLLESLCEECSLESIIEHLDESDRLRPFRQLILAEQLRLTPLLAPRVFDVLSRLCADLGFEEALEVFVYPRGEINAFALHRPSDDTPHVISLTSEVIRSMNDDELRFTLGHELGHLGLGHCRVMMVNQVLGQLDDDGSNGSQRIPQLLERRLDKWMRLAEISADRVGFVGCGCDLSVAVSSFFKIASGLGPEHLCFDIRAFLSQLEDFERLDRKEVLARFSHPATPVRARALQLYYAAGGPEATPEQLAGVDAEVDRITQLMDFEASTELEVQTRDFLLAGGLLAAQADGQVSEEQQQMVTQLLLQVTGDPEAHFARIESVEQAEAMLEDACKWLSENAGQERYWLFGQLCHVVAVDGVLSKKEREFMEFIADRLGIPNRSAMETVHSVLSEYVRIRGSRATGFDFQRS